ncbi:MAG: DUF4129 domain-containing protein, partial [Cyanobacteria bacterium K_Offshore_0m_m2_072]|nr:DUF4129 domain-containing protein [Cyanobacteria bacterium K_Offshore_0m_m2_072]
LAASLSAKDRQRIATGGAPGWIQGLASQWQGLDTRWQLWVMQFDSAQQQRLLPPWLTGNGQGVMALLSLALCLAGGLVLVLQLERSGGSGDAARQALNHCLRELNALSLEPSPGESLQQFVERARLQEPALGAALQRLLTLYNLHRFGAGPQAWRPLQRELRAVRKQLRAYGRRRTT